jgi:hypothetical protein
VLGVGVWHGSAQADIDPSTINDAMLASVVDSVLRVFPRSLSRSKPP